MKKKLELENKIKQYMYIIHLLNGVFNIYII